MRFAFLPRCLLARLRLGSHLGEVHLPLPLAQLLDVRSLRQERRHFACCVFLLERVRGQARELRPWARALVGAPLPMAIAPAAPAAALLVTLAARRLTAFGHERCLWLTLRLLRRTRLALRALLVRPAFAALPLLIRPALATRPLLIRPTLAARALVALLLSALSLVWPALAALLRSALAATVLLARTVASLIAPLVATLAALAMLGTAFALRLLLATRLARRA